MRLGIIGLPQSGKTTIFNALTRGKQPITASAGRMEVHTAVVDVPDGRVDKLSAIFKPRKTIYAKVTYADVAGLEGGTKTEIAGTLLNQLSQMDGFIHVVRGFVDENVPHSQGSVNPARDLRSMDEEFILNDQIKIERKLTSLKEEKQKGAGRDKAIVEHEIILFEKLLEVLQQEKPLRDFSLSEDEEKIASGFGFLSQKPVLVVLNLGEGQTVPEITYQHQKSRVLPLQGRLEMDIAQLPPQEAEVFLKEYGIQEPSLSRMIKYSYDLLGLQSFFTVGEDEVRAWTVRLGALAPEAAGVVHTDLQKGFIRAEVIAYDDMISLGNMAEVRAHGKLRLEGKTYEVKDGDILNIRFNI
jgi:GTP-binding protein YchF